MPAINSHDVTTSIYYIFQQRVVSIQKCFLDYPKYYINLLLKWDEIDFEKNEKGIKIRYNAIGWLNRKRLLG